jgi:hypothetical protein
MSEKELLAKFEAEQLKKTHDETRSVLDELRRTRKSRGGVGAPLETPRHLSEGVQTIVLTDALNVKPRG